MRHASGFAGVALSCVLAVTAPAASFAAEQQQDQQSPVRPPDRSADFLFGSPRAAVAVRGSWVFASAGSDIFDFVTRQLTLEKRDFNRPGFAADVAFTITSRLQVEGGFDLTRMQKPSEYRALVDNNLQPIEQTTALNATHFTGGVRFALTPRGRAVSRLAWVPSKTVPFVGAGGGIVKYDFRQFGDFVDFVDNSIFYESFRSDGWSPSVYVLGGVDVQIHRAVYATLQGRFTKASGNLGDDFVDFDPIDLSGFRMSAGINLLF